MKHFGLIGKSLKHSFSKKYFDEKFKAFGLLDFDFRLIEIPDIEDLPEKVKEYELSGFSVTIPYKEAIIPFCHSLSPEAEKICAVNCVKVTDNGWVGYNTDYMGFRDTLPLDDLAKGGTAIVFGTGGASRAIIHVLSLLGLEIVNVSTSSKKGTIHNQALTDQIIKKAIILVNCTPLGTFPEVDKAVPINFSAIHKGQICYDLVYNPDQTKFLRLSAQQGARTINGMKMLIIQAEEAWKIWNS
ncbi:MAG TPA: shikimate dehydrogenase [Saprospiraceae bacterium]|nr:shikimate dehydrogenase [Saprospiraceae bacterium]HRP84461.1 shikimate dehydrogenase [Saprospiraceae bacterium]